jgi:hypothetical protein
MVRKIIFTVSLTGLLLGTPAMSNGMAQEPNDKQQEPRQEMKSVNGKIADIGDQGRSFTLDTGFGGEKQILKFVLVKDSQVKGQIEVGTIVAVDYKTLDDGQLVCVRVAAQS